MTSDLRATSRPALPLRLTQMLAVRPPGRPPQHLPPGLARTEQRLQRQQLNDEQHQPGGGRRPLITVRPGSSDDRTLVRAGERAVLLTAGHHDCHALPGAVLDFSLTASRRLLIAALGERTEYLWNEEELPASRAILKRLSGLLPDDADVTTDAASLARTPLDPLFLDVQFQQRGRRLLLLLMPEGPQTVTLYAGVHRLCMATAGDLDPETGEVKVHGLTGETLHALHLSLEQGFFPLEHTSSQSGLKFARPQLPGSVLASDYDDTGVTEDPEEEAQDHPALPCEPDERY